VKQSRPKLSLMSTLFPLHEIAPKTPWPNPPVIWAFPATEPRDFSISLASRLIELCAACETQQESSYTQAQGCDLFVAIRGVGDAAHLFNVRGATDVKEIPFGGGNAYGPLVESYVALIQAIVGRLPLGRRIWLTGHGVGGAYALLAAVELTKRQESVAAVYTFGSPRVGDKHFVRFLPFPVFRVVNNLDLMVTMPTPWKWRHAGRHLLIDARGRLLTSPNPWDRIPAMLRQTVWLGEMLADGLASGFPRAIYRLLAQVLADHAASSYRLRLQALAIPPKA